ncbi:hypothetical protein QH494_07500 [Sphingomonas sp. AR_OL41]|uniref:hypothetical protein n=1 Tax=Parasphingomonas halimpatiens TaxID=3096162 RepID=UPI002480123F|nr:hypothetical protein [Sphingomonas sp. AR_OL41]MDH7972028.1 hypothetical protein [Sphingomonas sp. AR_OL41]
MAEAIMDRHYETSLDRAGLSLAAGGVMGGVLTVLLVAAGRPSSWFAFPVGFVIGTVITVMAVVAIGGPLWIVAHASGRRGPRTALAIGALAGFALFLCGQTYGFGLFVMPPMDTRTILFHWISGAATSLILSLFCAGIAWTMWRVAYRRV